MTNLQVAHDWCDVRILKVFINHILMEVIYHEEVFKNGNTCLFGTVIGWQCAGDEGRKG